MIIVLLQCELIRHGWLAAGATGPLKKFANRLIFLKKGLSFVDIFSLR